MGVHVGLNSRGEGLWLTGFKLFVQGMQGVTERISLNWLFGISCIMLILGHPAAIVGMG